MAMTKAPSSVRRVERAMGIDEIRRRKARNIIQNDAGEGRVKNPVVSYASFHYQADGRTRARRVVAKVEWHQGELYPRVGFIVTN
jgi:hypothetical protein